MTSIGAWAILQANNTADRAGTSLVQPVPVGVQAILDVVVINLDAKFGSQAAGAFPGFDFKP
jgi:hypothetical protein